MSLPSILRQIAKKASHPNVLIHNIQLVRAKNQLLPEGKQLGDGKEDVFALEAPKEGEGKDGDVDDSEVSGGVSGDGEVSVGGRKEEEEEGERSGNSGVKG